MRDSSAQRAEPVVALNIAEKSTFSRIFWKERSWARPDGPSVVGYWESWKYWVDSFFHLGSSDSTGGSCQVEHASLLFAHGLSAGKLRLPQRSTIPQRSDVTSGPCSSESSLASAFRDDTPSVRLRCFAHVETTKTMASVDTMAKRCAREGVIAGAKAALFASVAAAIPTIASARMLPWARANLNHTAQALIVSTGSKKDFKNFYEVLQAPRFGQPMDEHHVSSSGRPIVDVASPIYN
ncbi:Early nodulin-93 [Apostasia shenzhenica]|uniref:Early nodulin-93 n=1 Tax=Apostasia shenzhenica TaxID=1088818 RepID=A0A2I0B9T9_9ASPA|nr:Early nodulin-93 [Apostasia shenzhenica]